ncbi:hypothetical protein EVA_16034 [gut metagenome]|uniref:Uncharacterized protein n=1 Tax=gut metagenome TaxID=749906 RepID=J9FLR5_9ZZZZ
MRTARSAGRRLSMPSRTAIRSALSICRPSRRSPHSRALPLRLRRLCRSPTI